jgi:hypothetical protein
MLPFLPSPATGCPLTEVLESSKTFLVPPGMWQGESDLYVLSMEGYAQGPSLPAAGTDVQQTDPVSQGRQGRIL